jgi:hypothetical protein
MNTGSSQPSQSDAFGNLICPQCGQPRAWTGWRLCSCGYDFGPVNGHETEVHAKERAARAETHKLRDMAIGLLDGLASLTLINSVVDLIFRRFE